MNERLQREVARLSARGWQIVSQSEDAVQMKKPRKWSAAGLVLFVVLPILGALIFGGIGLWLTAIAGLIVVTADYLLKKERLEYITAGDLEAGKHVKP